MLLVIFAVNDKIYLWAKEFVLYFNLKTEIIEIKKIRGDRKWEKVAVY